MANVTRNNTNAGSLTTFGDLSPGEYFERADQSLNMKLDSVNGKNMTTEEVAAVDGSESVVRVDPALVNVTYDP